MGVEEYFENKGNGVYVAHPDDKDPEQMLDFALKGFVDHVEAALRRGGKYFVVDFKKVSKIQSDDATETVSAHQLVRAAGGMIYFCNLGPESRNPHKMLKRMGLEKLVVMTQDSDQEVVAELLGK